MNRPTAKMQALAQRLVAHEYKKSFGTKEALAFGVVVDHLRGPLIVLAGTHVFRSLLSRALTLAYDDVQSLRSAHVSAAGLLECPPAMAGLTRKEIADAEVILIAHLLALLESFIGQALTLRLLQDVWPETPLNLFNSQGNYTRKKQHD